VQCAGDHGDRQPAARDQTEQPPRVLRRPVPGHHHDHEHHVVHLLVDHLEHLDVHQQLDVDELDRGGPDHLDDVRSVEHDRTDDLVDVAGADHQLHIARAGHHLDVAPGHHDVDFSWRNHVDQHVAARRLDVDVDLDPHDLDLHDRHHHDVVHVDARPRDDVDHRGRDVLDRAAAVHHFDHERAAH